jgi:hypothetical protein
MAKHVIFSRNANNSAPTTTTTAAPTTTTTTTFGPEPCLCVEVNITSAGGEVFTYNCFGENQNYVYTNAGTYYLCAAVIGDLLQAFVTVGTGSISPVGNCKTQTCPPPTTTTTTLAPTTTTTTIAPYCSTWTASNAFGAGYNIQYTYCGATGSTFIEVPANTTIYLCVQTGQISNLGNPIVLTEGSGSCIATTTSTTTTTAAPTTTTTTLAPYCSLWTASNGFGAGYNIEYTYCGATGSTFVEVPANTDIYLCVQSGQINNLGNPIVLTEDSASCIATTTSTTTTTTLAPTTTTTTTLAPFCNVWTASNAFGAGYTIKVKYCGDTSYSFPTVPPNSSIYVCVQNDDITDNNNPITLISSSVACTGSIITTTTTTTTAAPTTTTTTTLAPTTTTTTTTTSTTTTTTAAPTTTTTTTLASQKYYVESCEGPGDIVGVIEITNAPLLVAGNVIRLDTDVAGLSCFVIFSTSTGTITLGTRSVTNIYTDCVDCTD